MLISFLDRKFLLIAVLLIRIHKDPYKKEADPHQSQNSGAGEGRVHAMEAWSLKMKPCRVCRPVVPDLDPFNEEQDPDPHQSEKSKPDPHQSEKSDPNPHDSASDQQQHWLIASSQDLICEI